MGDLDYDKMSQNVRIGNSIEEKYADTQDDDTYLTNSFRKARLLVDSAVGRYVKAYSCIRIVTAGAIGDTITIAINGKPNVVLTLVAGDVGNIINTAASLASAFNGSANHNPPWFATIEEMDDDFMVVHIEALREGEGDAQRTAHGHFVVSSTGTTVVQTMYDNIMKRVTTTSIISDETHKKNHLLLSAKRLEPFKQSWFQSYLNNGGAIEMNVDGSSVNVVFGYFPDTQYDLYITEIRLHAQDDGSDMFDFMGIASGLSNGIRLDFKSKNTANVMMDIQTTLDMFVKFSYPSHEACMINQAHDERFVIASRKFTYPLVIKRQGTYTFDDYLVMRVRDDLTSMDKLRCTIFGYKEGVTV